MVRTTVSMIMVALILFLGAIYERNFVVKQFHEFDEVLETYYEKVDEQRATENDARAVEENWLDKKRVLHVFIPHNEIKEMELWLCESIILVRDEKWADALSKIEVLRELSQEIPKTFTVSLENIL